MLDLELRHIIFAEILPNMASYIIIHFILAMTGSMYAQMGLVFLGLVPFSSSNWATMIQLAWVRGSIFFADSIYYILAPIAAISLFSAFAGLVLPGARRDCQSQAADGRRIMKVTAMDSWILGRILSVREFIGHLPEPAGPVRAVREVSFDLKEGENLALIGESGCGKTTLGLALIRLLSKSARISRPILYRGDDGSSTCCR